MDGAAKTHLLHMIGEHKDLLADYRELQSENARIREAAHWLARACKDRLPSGHFSKIEEEHDKLMAIILPMDRPAQNVFEVVDVSDEEAFYTIGVFLSLQEAIAAIEAKAAPWTLCDNAMYAGDYASMEIRSRRIGLDPLNNGAVVWRRAWGNVYDEDADDNDWRVIIPNAPHHQQPEETL